MNKKKWQRVAAMMLALAGFSSQAPAQSFTEGFDDISLLAGNGWFIQNNSTPVGSISWFQGTSTTATPTPGPFNAYTGVANSYIGVNFNSTGSTGTISNWLGTPNRTLRNGDVLSFYTRKPTIGSGQTDYPDRLEVRLSTNGASSNVGTGATGTGDFSTLLLSVNPTLVANVYPQVWTQYTITLSGLPAPTSGRMAFRYFVTGAGSLGSNSDYIGIDQVVYTPYTCPAFTMTPSGALAQGVAGQAYSASLTQTGALGMPSYAITAGALPPGVTLSAGGTISGTPTATGTFNFTATVSDASGCSGTQSYSITVAPALPPLPASASATAGNGQATVSWTPLAADAYGTPITAYVVTAVQDGSKTCTTAGTGSSCTVAGLTNGTNYSFNVVATNIVGPSQPAVTNFVTPKGAQTIDFQQPPAQVFGTPFMPQATASSGLPVSFSVDSGPCQALPSGAIDWTAAGACAIRASQAGNTAFSAAVDVVRTVTASKAPQTISFTSTAPSNAQVGGTYPVAATGGASGNVVTFTVDAASAPICSISGSQVRFTAAGACTINANQLGNANYADATQVQQTVRVAAVVTTAIPTLGQWALMLLSVALAFFAGVGLRRAHAS